ncbi:hypothetical protein OV450_3007 [Actinobacteria bacterium OV450]|nr:hypothetical protein OV450_3007 [Actinobacteria bacterium OV450]
MRTVSVPLSTNQTHAFRYLPADDYRFDDTDAGHHDGTDNHLHT